MKAEHELVSGPVVVGLVHVYVQHEVAVGDLGLCRRLDVAAEEGLETREGQEQGDTVIVLMDAGRGSSCRRRLRPEEITAMPTSGSSSSYTQREGPWHRRRRPAGSL
jgi:hypothetical protein